MQNQLAGETVSQRRDFLCRVRLQSGDPPLVCICVQVCIPMHMHRGQRGTDVLLCHSSPYFLEAQFLTEPGSSLKARKSQDPSVSAHNSAGGQAHGRRYHTFPAESTARSSCLHKRPHLLSHLPSLKLFL